MCFMPEAANITVEQLRWGHGEKFGEARADRAVKPGRPQINSTGSVKIISISVPPNIMSMIPEGANKSEWWRNCVMSSADKSSCLTTNYRRDLWNKTYSIVDASLLTTSQKTSCITSLWDGTKGLIVSDPV